VQLDIGTKELWRRRVNASQRIDMTPFDLRAVQLKLEQNMLND
jgi:hypothetical protein